MEKLIELLNEYEKENWRNFEVKEIWMTYRNNDLMVISKRYWFIKRLLDKEKIDLLRLSCTAIRYTEIIDADFSREDIIIMILSIQENPIDFLCEILK